MILQLEKLCVLSILLVAPLSSSSQETRIKVHLNSSLEESEEFKHFALRLETTLTHWYPYIKGLLLSNSLTYNAPDTIQIFLERIVDESVVAMASSEAGVIIGNINYYETHQHDIGSMIHELVHIIQQYPKNNCPKWVVEGIADYVRYYHFREHHDAFRLPKTRKPLRKPLRSQTFREGYATTAYFLHYVTVNIRGDVLYWINKSCREGYYRDSLWRKLTGRSVHKLWKSMIKLG